jgi:hypothetical protein
MVVCLDARYSLASSSAAPAFERIGRHGASIPPHPPRLKLAGKNAMVSGRSGKKIAFKGEEYKEPADHVSALALEARHGRVERTQWKIFYAQAVNRP